MIGSQSRFGWKWPIDFSVVNCANQFLCYFLTSRPSADDKITEPPNFFQYFLLTTLVGWVQKLLVVWCTSYFPQKDTSVVKQDGTFYYPYACHMHVALKREDFHRHLSLPFCMNSYTPWKGSMASHSHYSWFIVATKTKPPKLGVASRHRSFHHIPSNLHLEDRWPPECS